MATDPFFWAGGRGWLYYTNQNQKMYASSVVNSFVKCITVHFSRSIGSLATHDHQRQKCTVHRFAWGRDEGAVNIVRPRGGGVCVVEYIFVRIAVRREEKEGINNSRINDNHPSPPWFW